MTLPSVDDALADIAGEAVCRCHAAYKDRGMKDPACNHDLAESVEVVRAELLRLARENAELHKSALDGYEDGWHALRNERDALKAELAKLKARIEAAPVVVATRNGIVRTLQYHEYPSRARIRLLVEDEG